MVRPVRIALLLFASIALAALLEWIGLPAGLLIGPLIAAIVFAANGGKLTVPQPLSAASQAGVGLLIARSLNTSVLTAVAREPWLYAGVTLTTIGASVAIGWVVTRCKVLPGRAAVWGSMPGAATAMVLMARDEGADWQLVAVMSYLRVIIVAALASILAAVVTGHGGSHPPGGAWFPAPSALGLTQTALIGLAGVYGGKRIGLPAAALLGPMILGAVLEGAGVADPQLPGWLLAPAYLLIGWRIGLSFIPEIVAAARRAAPGLLIATAVLVLISAGCGLLLARLTGKDLLTAYLATSPGGADSVAIIANATPVDVSFVMSMQVLRFIAVLIVGPALARAIARRLPN